ncbi:UDP-N-acetylglucosamine 1-carboxyvinyltransferase [Vitreimonas flagellata]|uniref:UDP-N-acetylglucosamine 1-carboxyvinyltransferase n=1 Tax=Vitreimonas flagellata TaxID=2560861 RepID=UPI0010753544|nr:UDP-N-acetylglucosamine 1-carboxyvinyltransferase [Vitreimonas flagellata]
MDRIVISGGSPLNGIIPIYGAKNSALKLQAAALLCGDPLILENMPDLADTRFMVQLLASLGVEITWIKETRTLRMHAAEIASTIAPYDQVRKMRASFNVLGPLLARVGHATVSLPGGCAIGARPVDLHLKAFEAMGADIVIEQGYVKAAALRGLRGAEIEFPFVSVGATEHAMLAAVLAQGDTVLKNSAREPEIADLADCLNAMGARVEGAGTSEIRIKGVTSLKGTKHPVVGDRIEAGTYALAAATAGGDVLLSGARAEHLGALIDVMKAAGVEVRAEDRGLRIKRDASKRLKPVDFETEPFPGFPTDLQAQTMAMLCFADGQSRIRETIFENRFMHAPELARLGAQIAVHGNEAVVTGVDRLIGAPVMATDLRASVSLVIAGLAAEGDTIVNRVYHLDRGFEGLEGKLSACGARIVREKEEQA